MLTRHLKDVYFFANLLARNEQSSKLAQQIIYEAARVSLRVHESVVRMVNAGQLILADTQVATA
jgi:hypothetical protein